MLQLSSDKKTHFEDAFGSASKEPSRHIVVMRSRVEVSSSSHQLRILSASTGNTVSPDWQQLEQPHAASHMSLVLLKKPSEELAHVVLKCFNRS